MTWLEGWSYRCEVNVTNNLSNDIEYQFEIVLPSTFDYNLVSFDDGRDFRVTDSLNNILPYWIEYFSKTEHKGIIWFKATVPANSITTFYLYYGNPEANDSQNPYNVFPVFNDFSENTNPFTLSGTGSVNVTDGVARISDISGDVFFYASSESNVKVILKAKSYDEYLYFGGLSYNDSNNWYSSKLKAHYNSFTLEKKIGGSWNIDSSVSALCPHNYFYRVKFIKTGTHYYSEYNGYEVNYNLTTITTSYAGVGVANVGATNPVLDIDYIAIANAVDNEPTVELSETETLITFDAIEEAYPHYAETLTFDAIEEAYPHYAETLTFDAIEEVYVEVEKKEIIPYPFIEPLKPLLLYTILISMIAILLKVLKQRVSEIY